MSLDVETALPRPAAPSTTQSHGTVLLALLAGFVVLAVLLGFSVRGIGPFEARLVSSTGTAETRQVVVEVTNEGRRAGRGNCLVSYKAGADARPSRNFMSERVEPGGTVRQVVTLTNEFDATPTGVVCR